MNPVVAILLTTFEEEGKSDRTNAALRTIRGIKQNLIYDQVLWYISDDASPTVHTQAIVNEIGPSYQIHLYNSMGRNVGHGMNHCLKHLWEMGIELTMILEDDWELVHPLNFHHHVNLLTNHADIGMIRMGYLSAGIKAELIARENKLWWKIENNGYQYQYAGHASLRHKRFHDTVGMFSEGLRAGENELDFCAKFNAAKDPPAIVWDAEYGQMGAFAHIGGVSVADKPVRFK